MTGTVRVEDAIGAFSVDAAFADRDNGISSLIDDESDAVARDATSKQRPVATTLINTLSSGRENRRRSSLSMIKTHFSKRLDHESDLLSKADARRRSLASTSNVEGLFLTLSKYSPFRV